MTAAAGRKRLTLSPGARRHLGLRRLLEEALETRRGALVAGGAIGAAEVSLLANLGLSWESGVYFADFTESGPEEAAGRLRALVAGHRSRGYGCQALEVEALAAIAADLTGGPFPSRIAGLLLMGSPAGPLLACLDRLAPLVQEGGVVILQYPDGQLGPASAAGRHAAAHGLEPGAALPGCPSLSVWIRRLPGAAIPPAAEPDPPSDATVVLCYPDAPAGKFRRLCERAGYRLSRDPEAPFDLAVKWHGETYTPHDPVLAELAAIARVVNLGCEDISKSRIEELHRQVFGYGALVDPRTYRGPAVRKANLNAQSRESIVDCPLADFRETAGYWVYQRLIRTAREPAEFEEYRVPITGPEIPCVVIKRRPLGSHFDRSAGDATLVSASDVFSLAEQERLLEICRLAGLDFGDLDVLRDAEDGRLHVLDLNPTPGGPGGGYTEEQRQALIGIQLAAAQRAFGLPG